MIDAERPEALWLALRIVQAVLRESPSALACSSSVRNPADLTASASSLILEDCRAFILAVSASGRWVMNLPPSLMGERQRITDAKAFKRAKYSLRIRSVRAGFGPNGSWRWELPCDRDGAREPVRAERRVPVDWVDGVERLDDYRPPTDVPGHRWRQFVSDCQSFLNSPENWAERAASLGWDARAL